MLAGYPDYDSGMDVTRQITREKPAGSGKAAPASARYFSPGRCAPKSSAQVKLALHRACDGLLPASESFFAPRGVPLRLERALDAPERFDFAHSRPIADGEAG